MGINLKSFVKIINIPLGHEPIAQVSINTATLIARGLNFMMLMLLVRNLYKPQPLSILSSKDLPSLKRESIKKTLVLVEDILALLFIFSLHYLSYIISTQKIKRRIVDIANICKMPWCNFIGSQTKIMNL